MSGKNHWETEAKETEELALWEEGMGWENLDPERYCQELTENAREGKDVPRKFITEAEKWSGRGYTGRVDTMAKRLFSTASQSVFPDTHKLPSFVTPKKPPLTDGDIFRYMEFHNSDHQDELLKFMRLYQEMKQFLDVKNKMAGNGDFCRYHQQEYVGEFGELSKIY